MNNAREAKRIIDALDRWGQVLQSTISETREAIVASLAERDRIARAELARIGLVVSGETETALPWHGLPRPRRLQVEAVFRFMRKNRDKSERVRNVSNACRTAFEPEPGGYPTWQSLKAYCYRPQVRDCLESRA